MSIKPIDNNDNDWYNRFFDFGSGMRRTKRMLDWHRNFFGMDPFKEFDDMERQMDSIFGRLRDIQTNAPKELVREYQTSDGSMVREVGPLVYGYSMTIGSDGKPKVREFGNVRSPNQSGVTGTFGNVTESSQQISAEREPLVDLNTSDKEVKVVLELPGVKKEDIKISAFEETVEVSANNSQRKYHKTIELPKEANPEVAKSTYQNGILEIVFSKRDNAKRKGKEIKIE